MLDRKLSFDSVGIDFGPSVWGKLFTIYQTWKIATQFRHLDVLRLIITDTFHSLKLNYVCPPRNDVYFTKRCVSTKWGQTFDLRYGASCLRLTKNEKTCQIFVHLNVFCVVSLERFHPF